MFKFFIDFLKLAAEVAVQVTKEMRFDKPSDQDFKHRASEIVTAVAQVQYDDGRTAYRVVVKCGDTSWMRDYSAPHLAEIGKDLFVGEAMRVLNC